MKLDVDYLLTTSDPVATEELFAEARRVRDEVYGRCVFMRGLIEITNHCKNNCLYCGIRRDARVQRYRLTQEQILACCQEGHRLGFRTFVLQGGEDAWFTDEVVCDIVATIKREHPDCAVTLSLGERGRESFQRLREAGADRYLLRHETADAVHYGRLHPEEMSFDHRMQCLRDLRELGFQVETAENGKIAVDKVAGSEPGHFDGVLMDIQMPVMNGYDAAKAIRALANKKLAGIPIVAMTANAFAEDVQAAKDAGMNGHIAKPINIPQMVTTLKSVLK